MPIAHLLAYPIECTRQPLCLPGLDVLDVGVGHAGTGVGTICTGSGALLWLNRLSPSLGVYLARKDYEDTLKRSKA